jgi:hypothetical protein
LRHYADEEAVSLTPASSPAFGAGSRGCAAVILDKRLWIYLMKIDGSQHHGSISLNLLFEELTRCSLLNCLAQPDKLICPLIWLHVTPTLKIVHRRSADRAQNYLTVIEHRELKDHPIEVVTVDLASLQHCNLQ